MWGDIANMEQTIQSTRIKLALARQIPHISKDERGGHGQERSHPRDS